MSLTLEAGTIHALIGENGAGKSTLMKILGGVYFQEEGEICIEGRRQQFTKAKDALTAGVGIIYQEFNLVPTLSIAENIYLGKELHTSRGVLNRKQMVKAANEFMEQLGFEMVDCSRSVSALSGAAADGGDRQSAVQPFQNTCAGRADGSVDRKRKPETVYNDTQAERAGCGYYLYFSSSGRGIGTIG